SPLGFGPHCVLIPHFDNAEGGTHDTRFCYMGERRLQALEAMLPDDAWVLGVDEHTALTIDIDAGDVTVTGRGAVTVRRRERAERFPSGEKVRLTSLVAAARDAKPVASAHVSVQEADTPSPVAPTRSPLLSEVARLEQSFAGALTDRRAS